MRFFGLIVIVAGLLASGWQKAAKTPELSPQGYVSDFAGVISADTKKQIETLCGEVDQKAHAQIAVVTVTSLKGESVEQFTVDLAMGWGIGPKGNSRGVLILLAPTEHKYRIEVGYGLEPILPDGKVGSFGREAVPLLQSGDYSGAVMLLARRVAETIAADQHVTLESLASIPSAPAPAESNRDKISIVAFLIFVFLFFWIVSVLFRRATYRGRRAGWFGGPWYWGGGGWSGGGWSGGSSWGGGGGGGGGGFGGFGGGSFGGGGASGSW